MTLPVLERIAQEIFNRIKAGPSDGYTYKLEKVERPARGTGITFGNMHVAIVQHEPEANDDYSLPGNPPATAWTQPFAIYLIIRPGENDKTPDDQVMNAFQADVETAIKEPADWYQFGGLSVNASIEPYVPFQQENGAHSGRILLLNVIYRVDETNPRNVRA